MCRTSNGPIKPVLDEKRGGVVRRRSNGALKNHGPDRLLTADVPELFDLTGRISASVCTAGGARRRRRQHREQSTAVNDGLIIRPLHRRSLRSVAVRTVPRHLCRLYSWVVRDLHQFSEAKFLQVEQ